MDTSRAKRVFVRGIKLRCPECGMGRLYRTQFRMNAHCEHCGLIYEREQGYFIGAIYINIIVTETLLLGTLLIYGLVIGGISQTILTTLVILAIVMPLLSFHHSRSLWLCFDHLMNPRRSASDARQ
ncbi:MAG: DUF983 domain-containing protein [Blastocatellia bacterium]